MPEPETIEAEVTEELGQALEVAAPAPVNLFRTEDPAEVLRKATATATVLAQVLRKQDLISVIQGREHVKAEGWTLLGSMLGVFPVCTWTRRLEHEEGWEARVEARTMSGAIVGAAEAECTRSENMWSHDPTGRGGRKLEPRDDHALRSMAQTRASSKALKQPLGFIVKLAGFDPTPAEEMPQAEQRREGGLGPTPVPRSWTKVRELVETFSGDSWIMFEAYVRAASYHLYGETESKKLTPDQRKVMLQKAAGAAVWLNDNPNTPVDGTVVASVEHFAAGWAHVLDGTVLEIPDYTPPENPVSDEGDERLRMERIAADEEAERLADEVFTGP